MDGPDVFVGLDMHKRSIVVALADAERGGEVRRYGDMDNDPIAIGKLVRKLEKRHRRLEFVDEAGPCGYGLYRQLTELGCSCRIVAPSRTPKTLDACSGRTARE